MVDVLREATIQDLDGVIDVHRRSFKCNLLTRLGNKFLYQYYRLFLSRGFVLLVVTEDDCVVGFAAGVNNQSDFSVELKKNIHRFILPLSVHVVNPQIWREIFDRVVRLVRYGRVVKTDIDLSGYNELLSFAVCPTKQGDGLGGRLYEAFEAKMIDCNRSIGMCLTTDATGNDLVVGFYKRRGFFIREAYTQAGGRQMLLLLKNCSLGPKLK